MFIVLRVARDFAEDGTEDEGGARRGSGRQGPRSPLRSRRSRAARSGSEFDDSLDEAEQEDESPEKEKEKPVEEPEEELKELLTISNAVYAFPMRLIPALRATENKTQPLLMVPAPHPDLIPVCASACASCSCSACCAAALDPEHLTHPHNELEILRSGNIEMQEFLLDHPTGDSDQVNETDRLLSRSRDGHIFDEADDEDFRNIRMISRLFQLDGLFIDKVL